MTTRSRAASAALRPLAVAVPAAATVAVATLLRKAIGRSRRGDSLAVTSRLLRRLGTSTDPRATRDAVCDAVAEIAGGVGAFLLEPDGDGALVPTGASTGELPDLRVHLDGRSTHGDEEPYPAPEHGLALAEAFNASRPIFRSDIRGWSTPVAHRLGGVSALWQPVLGEDGKAVGVLVVLWGRRLRAVPRVTAEAIAMFADEAAIVVRQSDLVSRLHRLATTDTLTGVPNLNGWQEAAEAALTEARVTARPVSFGVLDIDNFNGFNDDWGHEAANRLLRHTASAWRQVLGAQGTVARAGGDVFRLVLPGHGAADATSLMQALRSNTPDSQFFTAGLAVWDGQETVENLNARAESALFAAKRGSRGGVGRTLVDGDDNGEPQWRQVILDILEHRQIAPVFQPVVDLETGEITGYEALARPSGSGAGISVESMFATAQKMGVGRDLDWICRRAALEAAEALPQSQLLFLNISVATLLDPVHGADHTELLLEASGRDPRSVVLEISEREKIHDLVRLRAVLQDFRDAGFRFALDDVGEGHSTVETLAVANAEFIKLARSLVQGTADLTMISVIRGILEYARSSGASVLAEGIETEAEMRLMRELGVNFGQGYLLGRPEPIAAWMVGPAVAEG